VRERERCERERCERERCERGRAVICHSEQSDDLEASKKSVSGEERERERERAEAKQGCMKRGEQCPLGGVDKDDGAVRVQRGVGMERGECGGERERRGGRKRCRGEREREAVNGCEGEGERSEWPEERESESEQTVSLCACSFLPPLLVADR